MKKKISIIGAGLAGCEAAWQLANRGYEVILYEKKRILKNEIQKLDDFCELVCSNTFRSTILGNAVGCLKEEMKLLDSFVLNCALETSIPAGESLAVDREMFSSLVTSKLNKHKNIKIIDKEIDNISSEEITLISSGPLTGEKLKLSIQNLVGEEYFYFFDAISPTIDKASINFNKVFIKNRYEKGETQDYINCPMSKEEYLTFYNELIRAETFPLRLENEKTFRIFEGCMPIEIMAKRDINTMRYGPLKPIGLRNLDGSDNYAVVQLRQDNAALSAYNMVGFQTNLKIKEQQRVFKKIPGLENAIFVRYGQMHENNYINSPTLLNNRLQLKHNNNIFFAGQITGVEGYLESAASGLVTSLNIINWIEKKSPIIFPYDTVIGALIRYILLSNPQNFQPMKSNWHIVQTSFDPNIKYNKQERREEYYKNSMNSLNQFISKYNITMK
ncbi:methylenetetrahydrofolate--tRNA-(uracil(54)-C(5))-methyltransferase (FADH(2)-oxidizing) TrmFO [Spiroplasma endosymbiont of Aspidapion aeneum]|uniref:methylenetetrahydrofolate--tRNA-(uracil(54)- C(5))-methyltransferase (FADH(2)-oxidizing) TrmFO n=1 Tax=Spiroplasma endosymbiont of Aspidapion aeneum TaxID=3066276 RepID=UPI00313E4C53